MAYKILFKLPVKKKSEKLSGSTKRFVKEDLRYLYYKFGLFEYWKDK